jgi:hypothetical protein
MRPNATKDAWLSDWQLFLGQGRGQCLESGLVIGGQRCLKACREIIVIGHDRAPSNGLRLSCGAKPNERA